MEQGRGESSSRRRSLITFFFQEGAAFVFAHIAAVAAEAKAASMS